MASSWALADDDREESLGGALWRGRPAHFVDERVVAAAGIRESASGPRTAGPGPSASTTTAPTVRTSPGASCSTWPVGRRSKSCALSPVARTPSYDDSLAVAGHHPASRRGDHPQTLPGPAARATSLAASDGKPSANLAHLRNVQVLGMGRRGPYEKTSNTRSPG